MQLRALRSFRLNDRKTGRMINQEKGSLFELDHAEEGELIYSLLQSRSAYVEDEKFIPKSWRYVCVHAFHFKNEGILRSVTPGREVTLSQKVASEFLSIGFIKPVDEDGWTPKKLLGPTVKEDNVKKMFDDLLPEKEPSWVRKGMR